MRLGDEIIDLRDVRDLLGESEDARKIKAAIEEVSPDFDEAAFNEPTLIHDRYFPQYAEDYARDIGIINSRYTSEWPLNYIDWEEAAEDLKVDYIEYEIEGHIYYGRGW